MSKYLQKGGVMKKSIQLDAMRRDDAKRNLKIDAGISKKIEKLNDYLFDIFNITLEKNELKKFCKINNNDNLESLKEKLYNEYTNSHQIETKKNDNGKIVNKKENSIISEIYFYLESKILKLVYENYKEDISLLIHDGFICRKYLELEELQNLIKEKLGYEVKYSRDLL